MTWSTENPHIILFNTKVYRYDFVVNIAKKLRHEGIK